MRREVCDSSGLGAPPLPVGLSPADKSPASVGTPPVTWRSGLCTQLILSLPSPEIWEMLSEMSPYSVCLSLLFYSHWNPGNKLSPRAEWFPHL